MNEKDRKEMREMLSDMFTGHANMVNGRFDVMQVELSAIKEQTQKTNGRVNKLEDETEDLRAADLKHSLNCPLTGRVEMLEKSDVSRKSVLKFIITSAGVAASVATVIALLVQLIFF